MVAPLLLAMAVLGQADTEPPAVPAVTLHLGMEIEDLDHEIERARAALQVAQARLSITQRALQRGVSSRSEVEQVTADVKSLEAREAEAIAFRALKVYERGVLEKSARPDPDKAFGLVMDLLKKQETMAQVEVDFQGYRLKQEEALLVRGAASRPERDNAALDYDTARLHVALSRARQAQATLAHARRPGARPAGADELRRLRDECVRARVQYYEIGEAIAKSRLTMARDQLRHGRFNQSDVDYYQNAFDTAAERLSAERKRLADPEAPVPDSLPRAG